MGDFVQVTGVNLEEFKQALRECPTTAFQFLGRKMGLEANRFRKKFIAERMSGDPGLRWSGVKKVGGNVKTKVTGTALQDLKMIIKLSHFLALHETGAVITPTHGQWLYLKVRAQSAGARRALRAGGGKVYAGPRSIFTIAGRVRSVTIRPRLGFRALFNRETPAILDSLGTELNRAIVVSMERRMKSLAGAIRQAVA